MKPKCSKPRTRTSQRISTFMKKLQRSEKANDDITTDHISLIRLGRFCGPVTIAWNSRKSPNLEDNQSLPLSILQSDSHHQHRPSSCYLDQICCFQSHRDLAFHAQKAHAQTDDEYVVEQLTFGSVHEFEVCFSKVRSDLLVWYGDGRRRQPIKDKRVAQMEKFLEFPLLN